MKLLFKTILLISLLFQIALASDVKFVFMTDIDINANKKQTITNFKNAIDEINSYKDIDFVVLGGNNLAKANMDNLKCFIKYFKKINKKTYVLLGSNDVLSSSGVNKKYYMRKIKLASFFSHSSKLNYTFKKNGYRFVIMDGSKQYFQSTNGYYDTKEIMWLDKILTKYEKDDVIILQHFPLLKSSSEWKMTAKIENYIDVLQKHNNVKVIVSGHYNTNLEQKTGNIYHILTENFSQNGAYKIIEINLKEDFIGTYLVK